MHALDHRLFRLGRIFRGHLTSLGLFALLSSIGCSGAGSSAREASDTLDEPLYGLGSLGTKWDGGRVPVCFKNVSDRPDLQAKIRWILEDGWAAAGNVTFTGFGACASSGNQVAVEFVSGTPGETTYIGASNNTIQLVSDDATGAHFRYEVLHEFGHALGFVHEQERPDNFNSSGGTIYCGAPSNGTAPPAYLDGGVYFTGYDSDSIMDYCAAQRLPNFGAVQNLSAGDISGVKSAYGAPSWTSRAGDILWRDDSGVMAVWRMAPGTGAHATEAYPGPVDGTWTVAGTGDFDGDGIGDILWRRNDGTMAVWFMNSGNNRAQAYPGTVDASWQVQGIGDFDGDHRSDILWRSTGGVMAIWYSGNAPRVTSPKTVDSSWAVQGIGDFDGNGKSDILWRKTDGTVAIWYDGFSTRDPAYPGAPDSSWSIQGTGDFDGDGHSDILWRRSGVVAIWYSGSTQRVSYPGSPDDTWRVQATGDFDGDGQSDILWRQTTSASNLSVWFSGATARVYYPGQVPTSWHVQGTLVDHI